MKGASTTTSATTATWLRFLRVAVIIELVNAMKLSKPGNTVKSSRMMCTSYAPTRKVATSRGREEGGQHVREGSDMLDGGATNA